MLWQRQREAVPVNQLWIRGCPTKARWIKVLQMQSRWGPSYKGGLWTRQRWAFWLCQLAQWGGEVSATLRLVSPSENQIEDHPQDLKDMRNMSHQLSTWLWRSHLYHDYCVSCYFLLSEEAQHIPEQFSHLFTHWNHLGSLINTHAWLHLPEILKKWPEFGPGHRDFLSCPDDSNMQPGLRTQPWSNRNQAQPRNRRGGS